MTKRLFFLLPISLFLVVGVYFMAGLKRDPAYMPSMLIDRPAPVFALPPIEGRTEGLSNEDFAGEVVLLNVFGSWCAGCLIEHPVLMEIAADGAAPLLGLNWRDKPGDAARWLARHGDPYARIGDDADGRVAIDFGVTGAPETFVIDAKGRVRHKHVGPIAPEDWRGVIKPMIEELKKDAGTDIVGDAGGRACAGRAGACG